MANGKTKKVLNIAFAAMVVFTAAMTVATIVNASKRKQEMIIPDDIELVQTETIKGNIADDASVAVVSTDMGDFALELYPQFAPDTVANFISLAESGYYDNTFVYEVEKGIHIGGGCKYNDGALPEGYDRDSEMIGPEISKNLWPVKGAVMSCGLTHSTLWSGQETYSGSRFLISGSIEFSEEEKDELLAAKDTSRIAELFLEYGGTPNVSQQITVFAQVFDGWDVLDSLLSAEADEETLIPKKDISITGISICTYSDYAAGTEKGE